MGQPFDSVIPASVPDGLREGLQLLCQAHEYASDANSKIWNFAVELETLYTAGMTVNDLRWLVARGFATHGQEQATAQDGQRVFQESSGFQFRIGSCFVLTEQGVSFAHKMLQLVHNYDLPLSCRLTTGMEASPPAVTVVDHLQAKPRWDAERRELTVGKMVVKRFRVPARNQQLILAAFEEEGWSTHIDDPLPPSARTERRTRLHDAINRLNGRQHSPVLRFRGNGNGDGVCWEFRRPDSF